MTSAYEIKKNLYNDIVEVVKRDHMVELPVLTATFCASTGFKERTISEVLKQLCQMKKIKIVKEMVSIRNEKKDN